MATGVIPQWTFGDRLSKVRVDVMHIEQRELAERLTAVGYPTSQRSVSKWEHDLVQPRGLQRLVRALEAVSGVPAAWFLGLDGAYSQMRPAADTVQSASRDRVARAA